MRIALTTIAFASSATLAPGVVTAGLIYDESVNGDLPRDATLAPLLTLVAGTNEIRGNTGFNIDFVATDFDSFRIHVGQGAFLIFGAGVQPFMQGLAVLATYWLILFWMYRRKLFLRI